MSSRARVTLVVMTRDLSGFQYRWKMLCASHAYRGHAWAHDFHTWTVIASDWKERGNLLPSLPRRGERGGVQ